MQGVTLGATQLNQIQFGPVQTYYGSEICLREVQRTSGCTNNRATQTLLNIGTHYACFVNDVGSAQGVEPEDPRLTDETNLFAKSLTKYDSGTILVSKRSQLLAQMTQFKYSQAESGTAAWAVLQAIILPSSDTMTVTVHMLWSHAIIGLHNTTATLYCTNDIHGSLQISYIHDAYARLAQPSSR